MKNHSSETAAEGECPGTAMLTPKRSRGIAPALRLDSGVRQYGTLNELPSSVFRQWGNSRLFQSAF